jgi:hypothetical protein
MRKKAAGFTAVAALTFTGVSSADVYTRVLNQHPTVARKMCKNYNNLLNLGWSDSNIYEVLHDAGSINNRAMFNAVVRWCFSH